jgi:Protein of unknown function (DUF2924)
MSVNVAKEVAALRKLTMRELRARYAEAYGETTHANNKAWLVKRIVWRQQAKDEGDLTERARRRAAELANDSDLRLSPPRPKATSATTKAPPITTIAIASGDRLPPPGTLISREYKGQTLQVTVLADGFEFEGVRYKSLSAVAKAITGQHMNGYLFFRLGKAVAS